MHLMPWHQFLEANLRQHIASLLPRHSSQEIYEYALFPAGKLFRPMLVTALALDFKIPEHLFKNPSSPHSLLASFVEIHHAYSLAHDDLPSMDDDDFRRGKASLHKRFGEWQALLIGDGLLVLSFQILSKINNPMLIKTATHLLGPKGLIHGQYLDLSLEMNSSIDSLIQTHTLKTSRLIQVSLVGSYLLTNDPTWKIAKDIHRYGESLGVVFQLVDDLLELKEKELSPHELLVNPWPKSFASTLEQVIFHRKRMKEIEAKFQISHVTGLVNSYLEKSVQELEEKAPEIEAHLKKNINNIIIYLR